MKFDKIQRLSNIDFITHYSEMWWSLSLYPAEYNHSKVGEISIKITRGEVTRKYHPVDYLNYIIEYYTQKMGQTTNLYDQHVMAITLRATISNQIESFKELLVGADESTEKYDFSSQMNKANNIAELSKGKIDIAGYRRERYKFWYGVFTGAATASIGLLTLYFNTK